MTDIVIPTDDAIDRIVEMIRQRLTDARANGQNVRMTARETGRTTIPAQQLERMSLTDLVTKAKSSGFELHIVIEGKS